MQSFVLEGSCYGKSDSGGTVLLQFNIHGQKDPLRPTLFDGTYSLYLNGQIAVDATYMQEVTNWDGSTLVLPPIKGTLGHKPGTWTGSAKAGVLVQGTTYAWRAPGIVWVFTPDDGSPISTVHVPAGSDPSVLLIVL